METLTHLSLQTVQAEWSGAVSANRGPHNFNLVSFFVCVHIHVHMCVCACICAHVCACMCGVCMCVCLYVCVSGYMWRPEVNTGVIP